MPSFVRSALLVDSHHPFPEPLLPVTEPGDAETSDLQAAITAWERSGRPDSFDPLEYFLAEHPQSPWSFSLTANMGILAARQAQFGKALHWLETAYELGKTQEESSLRRLADRALVEYYKETKTGLKVVSIGYRSFGQVAGTVAATTAFDSVLINGMYYAGALIGSVLRVAVNRVAASSCECSS